MGWRATDLNSEAGRLQGEMKKEMKNALQRDRCIAHAACAGDARMTT
jgi:hypothetical protein